MTKKSERICPLERANHLSTRWRRLIQSPEKICGPWIAAGDSVIDVGCGPGFFSIPMARMVGPGGRVIAVDLQQGMLDLTRGYAEQHGVAERIQFHLCRSDSLDLEVKADFALLFYVLHEIPDKEGLFCQLAHLLKGGGKIFICEPPFHVSGSHFRGYIDMAVKAGFNPQPVKKVALSKTALLIKK